MRLDADIREMAERMQTRRREAKKRVAEQEIIGMRFITPSHVGERALASLAFALTEALKWMADAKVRAAGEEAD